MKSIKCLALFLWAWAMAQSLGAVPPPPRYHLKYDFTAANTIPSAQPIVGAGDVMFGVTYGGAGMDGGGSVWALQRQSDAFHFYPVYEFNRSGSPANDIQAPYAALTLSPDATMLYGTCQLGGNGFGGIFSINIAQAWGAQNNGAGYTLCHAFNGATEGGGAQGPLACVAPPNRVPIYFGTCSESGGFGGGWIFWFYPPTGECHSVCQFSQSGTPGAVNGSAPQNALVVTIATPGPIAAKPAFGMKANTNIIDLSTVTLYGITRKGGSNDLGTVYSVKGNGSNFMVLHHFSSSTTNGAGPQGGLVLSSNVLYGTTASGGANYAGTIFKINTDGSGFRILKDFDGSTSGSSPQGDLALSGTTLYGTTYIGGTNGGGTVYSMSTSSSNFMVLHSFTMPTWDGNGNYTNSDGGWSVSGVTVEDNVLLGTTPYGGTNGVGTVYGIILPGPPFLRARPSGGNFILSWPSWASNYVLQQSSKLGSTNWATNNLNLAVSDNGTNRSVTVARTATNTFFRLFSTNSPGNP